MKTDLVKQDKSCCCRNNYKQIPLQNINYSENLLFLRLNVFMYKPSKDDLDVKQGWYIHCFYFLYIFWVKLDEWKASENVKFQFSHILCFGSGGSGGLLFIVIGQEKIERGRYKPKGREPNPRWLHSEPNGLLSICLNHIYTMHNIIVEILGWI